MTAIGTDRLYELLPALHRLHDVGEGRPLQTLLRAIAEQAEIVRQNVDRLWDDCFIDTCQDWVVPYIGDLVANNLLHDVGGRRRVDVARTVYYRRRKGTLPMLEELARDVTGWGARAVELFELLGWTQHLNHLRFQAGTADIRDIDRMDRVDGPFDEVSHSVDVRPPSTDEGWHNIRTIGFFLYRLQSFPRQGTVLTDPGGVEHTVRPQPRVAGAGNLFHFSSLGAPAPLFNRWRREGDEAGLATEPFVPGPIRPLAFLRDLERLAAEPAATLAYYGAAGLAGTELDECVTTTQAVPAGGSLAVFADGAEVPAERILCKDLSTWEAPAAGSETVAVDVRLGRLAFAPDAVPEEVTVEYHHGLAGPIGGGPYDRRRRDPTDPRYQGWGPDTVADPAALGSEPITVAAPSPHHGDIGAALAEWQAGGGLGPLPPVVVQIEDDRTYVEDLIIDVAAASRVVLQAANERRPTVVGTITIAGDNPDAHVVLDGLVVEGHVRVTGNLAELRLSHCTLVPGRALGPDGLATAPASPSVEIATSATALALTVDSSIVGPVRAPAELKGITVTRSVVDGVGGAAIAGAGGDDQAGAAELRQATVLGAVRLRTLELASDVIFTAPVRIERTQVGCVRFSYVEPGSVTPRRYRCQPDMALSAEGLDRDERARLRAALKPAFTSTRFHDPGYAQLRLGCPAEIATGAEDGSEMGVWSWLGNPQREANLRLRLDEYLPFGLDPALIYVT
jgi:hypothetical protein